MHPSSHSSHRYRPDIDGLRALAILSVVCYHAGFGLLPGGFAGVDVFFTISGYLITNILLRQLEATGAISMADFYARRMKRLLPCLTVVLAVTLLLGFATLPPFDEKWLLAKSGLASLFFLANHFFYSNTAGYFDGPAESHPLLHLWSLSVEEQFYLLWPAVLILVAKLSPRATCRRNIQYGLGVLTLASFAASVYLVEANPKAAFYLLPSRAWEMGAGAFLAVWSTRRDPFPALVLQGCGAAGLLSITASWLLLDAGSKFPGLSALLPVLGSAALILAGSAERTSWATRLLSYPLLTRIGSVSYGWYLWHWPLLVLARSARLWEPNRGYDLLAVLVAYGIAELSLRWVEDPIRHGRLLAGASQRKTLAAGMAVLTLLVAMYAGAGAWAKYGSKSPSVLALESETPPAKLTCLTASHLWDGRLAKEACTSGDPAGPLLIIWGDSQANAWTPGVRAALAAGPVEIIEMTMAECPPLLGLTPVANAQSGLHRCREFNSAVLAYLQKMHSTAPQRKIGVLLAARWPAYAAEKLFPLRQSGQWSYDLAAHSRAAQLNSLRQGLQATLHALRAMSVNTLLLHGQPEFRVPPIRCLSSAGAATDCDVPRADAESYRSPSVETIAAVASRYDNVRTLDVFNFLCDESACRAFFDGDKMSGYDDHHISRSAAIAYFQAEVRTLWWLTGRET